MFLPYFTNPPLHPAVTPKCATQTDCFKKLRFCKKHVIGIPIDRWRMLA